MTNLPPLCPLLGVPLAATDYASAVALTRFWAQEGGVRAVAAANTHVVALGRHDRDFAASLAQFDLIVPDGMPLVWAMNRRGAGLKDRVYGPTLMLHALAQPGVAHFLLGGSEELLERLTARPAHRGELCAPLWRVVAGGKRADFPKNRRFGRPIHLGGSRLPEAGTLGRPAQGGTAAGGVLCHRGGVRVPCRAGEPGSGVDAKAGAGMGLPPCRRTAQAVETLRGL